METRSPPRRTFLPGVPSPIPDEEDDKHRTSWRDIGFKAAETSAIMFASLAILGLAGLYYHKSYRWHSNQKMLDAFDGWDSAMELTAYQKSSSEEEDGWVERAQQAKLDEIVAGSLVGRYYLLYGEKGTGKSTMLLEAIKKVRSKGVVMFDAHADPEIFRIRLGKALHFEFFEDYLGSLFSIRGPRENSAILDIERAFNVLEQVALDRHKKTHKPLVVIINNAHLIRDDEEGRNLVELLQQKAETLSGSGLVTMVFNSDDYWLSQRLKRLGTRLDLISVADFNCAESQKALQRMRVHKTGQPLPPQVLQEVYHLVGGRAQHLSAVAGAADVVKACHHLIDREKVWFLNHAGLLGDDMDDDVMEFGKFSTAAMVLAKEMVELDKTRTSCFDDAGNIVLPRIPLWRARQVMTRPDYIQEYDNLNIFTLDDMSRVKPDSVVMMHAFREICSMPGFNELLDQTVDRVGAIESLGRTRELVLKDLLTGSYKLATGPGSATMTMEQPPEQDDDDDELMQLDQTERFYWKKRGLGHAKKYSERLKKPKDSPKAQEAQKAKEKAEESDMPEGV